MEFYFLFSVPRLSLVNAESGYHGLVKENETLVEVTPTIRAVGAKICSFHIVNKHHGEAPFQIILKDNNEAELRAKRALNCEKRKNYKFDIAAVSCSGQQSENATVHISVVDINEYAPAFLEPSYVCQVDEGRLYSEIIHVEASDRDCTPKYGDICKYEILTNDQPFLIDNEGTLRNTEPLDYERSHNHILSVVAYDCGMRQSQPVMVTVKVNRICKLGWKGIAERVDYAPGSGREDIFPAAQLRLCEIPCSVRSVQAKLSLATKHIDKGCDRDTYSVQSQRKLCGKYNIGGVKGGVSTDDGRESDQIFEFDGVSSAITVPSEVLDHGLAPVFTIATWLKHKHHPDMDRHAKEHILCSADDHKMNRHHYAWFVRNCRLILLLRRDFSEGDLNIFRPAEWRWKIPQVCDDEWHHYAISVRFPEAQLYVDGTLFKAEKKNPEIIDDWPLHPTKGINTTLTVGACWQGSEKKMKHHLKGYLAGLSVLLNKVESPAVLSCLHKCKESLDVPPMELLEPGMELLTNSDLTELSIEGDNKTNLEVLIRRIGYTNSREFPTPGRRNLHLSTTITCDHGRTVKVPNVESYVMVLPPQQPTLVINGTTNLASETTGVIEKRLDSCIVSVYPALNPDHETLAVPHNMITQFGITAKLSKDGATLTGSNVIYNYQQVLRQIQYTNRKPAYYLNRVFKLICSEMNGRFLSNEYVQTLTVIHPRAAVTSSGAMMQQQHEQTAQQQTHAQEQSVVAHAQVARHHVDVRPHAIVEHYSPDHASQPVISAASHAVTIILVVCVGFLVVMIVVGVVRIRAAHQRAAQEEINDTEMAWDDSALTITVNPMEVRGGGAEGGRRTQDEDDSSDDNSTYRDDDEDDDDIDSSDQDDVIPVGKLKDLEWDNSTLAI
ncbi:hypothetical protein AAG570_002323 [Ranatra chinensis]|uniref:Cadherin domain-containing protein n=1 Tax=Ranatra chinensis TaxID=642074 RepID=A0ABD0Y757_9HEMI